MHIAKCLWVQFFFSFLGQPLNCNSSHLKVQSSNTPLLTLPIQCTPKYFSSSLSPYSLFLPLLLCHLCTCSSGPLSSSGGSWHGDSYRDSSRRGFGMDSSGYDGTMPGDVEAPQSEIFVQVCTCWYLLLFTLTMSILTASSSTQHIIMCL